MREGLCRNYLLIWPYPPTAQTIVKAFVADMPFVAQRSDGRPSPNPNVLIEYDWATMGLTYHRIICVMNTSYGKTAAPRKARLTH
jgi:hypothetical protein